MEIHENKNLKGWSQNIHKTISFLRILRKIFSNMVQILFNAVLPQSHLYRTSDHTLPEVEVMFPEN